MSTTAAVVAMTAANQATLAASQARTERCIFEIRAFQNSPSTTPAQYQELSSCIRHVYPVDMPDSAILCIKAGVVFLLLCIAIGAVRCRYDRFIGGFEGFGFGLIALLLVVAVGFIFFG